MVVAHPLCLEKVKTVAKKLKIRVLTLGAGEDCHFIPFRVTHRLRGERYSQCG